MDDPGGVAYVPPGFAMSGVSARAMLSRARAVDLVTWSRGSMRASFVPVVHEPASGSFGSLVGHVARANAQWRAADGADALVVVHGPDAYVSPSWYASKKDHGRVVPTWNYSAVYATGRLVVHDDPDWVESVVRRLTEAHEGGRARPWSVDDAPRDYLEAQLRAVVGVEVVVARVEGKAKWSQNRSGPDSSGVLDGLEEDGELDAAREMRRVVTER
ncbi:MAG: FMN-binding negative transcriptional regulator [Actinomycetota bacterium]|nr:FMN-binding negative transcriptional regulator [Actinomycetota bacterium]